MKRGIPVLCAILATFNCRIRRGEEALKFSMIRFSMPSIGVNEMEKKINVVITGERGQGMTYSAIEVNVPPDCDMHKSELCSYYWFKYHGNCRYAQTHFVTCVLKGEIENGTDA